MASFNSAKTIRRAVNSVLAQKFSNIELLIIDAASKDETPEILHALAKLDPRIRIILRDEQRSFVEAFSDSLEMAQGQFFCLVDADDFISQDWIGSLLERLSESQYIGAFGSILLIDPLNNFITELPSSCKSYRFSAIENRRIRLLAYVMEPENAGKVNLLYSLWRTDVLRQVGAWPSHCERIDDDYLFCLKMLAIGQVAHVHGPWICRTVPSAEGIGRFDLEGDCVMAQVKCRPAKRKWSRWTFPPIRQFARFAQSDRIGWILSFAIALRSVLALSALPFRAHNAVKRPSGAVSDPT
jgi:cellulose synthase/poly-beta-1,6-N-acetylglucosamine synthase-like glycosyltransferase